MVCGVHGLFGERMADALRRQGAEVVRVEGQWGRAIPTESLVDAIADGPTAAVFVVHGETSTGVAQPLDGIADACREQGALFLLDCVTSLTGHPLDLDAAGVDAAFSGTQKCLNVPPGLAPFTLGERALERVDGSSRSWYFDLSLVLGYWRDADSATAAPPRSYHHTAPINLVYALREGLALVDEEGLDARWARHATAHEALRDALAVLGLERLAPEGEALHPLLAVRPPEGIDEAQMRGALLREHGIEISGGLGPLAGKLWRIGVMGGGREPRASRAARHRARDVAAARTGRCAGGTVGGLVDVNDAGRRRRGHHRPGGVCGPARRLLPGRRSSASR